MDDLEDPPPSNPAPTLTMSFGQAISFEASLLIIAAILSWIFAVPLFADFHWAWKATFLGASSTLPMLAFFVWMLQSEYPPFVEIRNFLNQFFSQLFGKWSLLQLAALSAVAGVAEEILFRGVIQTGVANFASPTTGILVASFAFALCHALTKAYFISTFIIGIYLSFVWQAADNILAPIITHALYDFVALVYFKKWRTAQTDEPKTQE